MVFGSNNKFRIRRSQSKASYLAYRREPREKERGLPNFQGSYKRTMSPSGGRIVDNSVVSDEQPTEKECEIRILTKEPRGLEGAEVKVEASQTEKKSCDIDVISRTLPRNYSLTVVQPKRNARPVRAQSDPTSSAKIEKTTVSIATQDNLEKPEEEVKVEVVVKERSDERSKEGEGRSEKEEGRVMDAASQTTPAPSPPPLSAPPPPRRHLQEEIECDQLSRDLASQLSPSHKLHGILVPGPDIKKTTDYVTGLFRLDFPARSRGSIALLPTTVLPLPTEETEKPGEVSIIQNGHCSPPVEPKSRLPLPAVPPQTDSITSSMSSLQQKKEELMMRLTRKLSVLRAESVAVNEETGVNEALGLTVTERVERVARAQEVAKFRLHVKEVGHITSLLLSLSGRLARAENALLTLSPDHTDRKTLEEKRDKLLGQLSEAKQLKANIDKRSGYVSSMLYNYLTGEEYTDYDHFINMKSKLLVDSREIAEKIQLGEEQLSALKETLDQVR